MAKRPSNLKKSKAVKDKENYELTGSDLTSYDVFLTTESNETKTDYDDYKRKRRNYFDDYYTSDTYDSKIFEKYDLNYGRGEESYTYDDFTTSAISSEDTKKHRRHFSSPHSKSEEIYSYIHSPKRHNYDSLDMEFDYSKPRRRKRSKFTRNPHKSIWYNLEKEHIKKNKETGRSQSPRQYQYYENYIQREPEERFDYKKYFERAMSRDNSIDKHKKKEKLSGFLGKQNKKIPYSTKKEQDYQVFAYQEPNQHEGAFKINKDLNVDKSISTEIEVKTHEYPILAFKDTNSGGKESDTVYLPILVMDKSLEKSEPVNKTIPTETLTPTQLKNIQVLAANIEGQTNIFNEFKEIPTKNTQINSSIQHTPEIPSSLKYASSLLGSIFDKSEFKSKTTKDSVLNDTKINKKMYNDKLSYRVNIDSGSITKDALRNSVNNQFKDPLHDDYPVTKDYIKVDYNIVEQQKKSMTSQESPFAGNKKSINKQSIRRSSGLEAIKKKKLSQNVTGSVVIPVQKSIIEEPFSQSRNSRRLESKQGSMAIVSNLERDNTLEIKSIPGTTILSVISKNQADQDRSTRASAAAEILKVPSTYRKSRVRDKQNSNQQNPSQTNLSRIGSKLQRGKTSTLKSFPVKYSTVKSLHQNVSHQTFNRQETQSSQKPETNTLQQGASQQSLSQIGLQNQAIYTSEARSSYQKKSQASQKQPSLISRGRISYKASSKQETQSQTSGNKMHRSIMPENEENSQYINELIEKYPQEDEETLEPLPRTTSILTGNKTVGKISFTVPRNETVISDTASKKRSASKIHSNVQIQRVESEIKLPLKKTSVIQNTHSITQNQSKESQRSVGNLSKKDLDVPSKQGSMRSDTRTRNVESTEQEKELIQEPSYIVEEKVSSVQDLSTSEPERKISFRNIVSTLVHFGRKPSTLSKRPNIQLNVPSKKVSMISVREPTSVKPGMISVREPTSVKPDKDIQHSPFIQSIEPTSSLYKKDRLTETPHATKTSVVEKKPSIMSKLFSRSKNLLRERDPSEKQKDTRKSIIHKPRSRSRLWRSKKKQSKASSDASLAPVQSLQDILYESSEQEHVILAEKSSVHDQKRTIETPCKCYLQYADLSRRCGYFFLGTTLHEQIINIIKVFYVVMS